MSFILDALKKSENDRQRQSGPALFEVRVAPTRSKLPSWAIALVGLLVVNLAVIGWLLFRRPATAAVPQTPAVAATPAPAPAVTPTPQAAPPPTAQYAPPPAGAPIQQGQVPQQYPAQNYSPPPPGQTQPQYQQQYPQQQYPQQQQFQQPAPPTQQEPTLDERVAAADANPDDYAPAAEPTGDAPLGGSVRRGLANGLMTYEEAATKNTIPALRLDLHVYAPDPRKRFVLVNMKRLQEGQSLPEGVRVDSITNDGAVLSYRGIQFMMERD